MQVAWATFGLITIIFSCQQNSSSAVPSLNETEATNRTTLSGGNHQLKDECIGLRRILKYDDNTFEPTTIEHSNSTDKVHEAQEAPVLVKESTGNETNIAQASSAHVAYHTKPDKLDKPEMVAAAAAADEGDGSSNDSDETVDLTRRKLAIATATVPSTTTTTTNELLASLTDTNETQASDDRWQPTSRQPQSIGEKPKKTQQPLPPPPSSSPPSSTSPLLRRQNRTSQMNQPTQVYKNSRLTNQQLINYLKLLNSMRLPEVTIMPTGNRVRHVNHKPALMMRPPRRIGPQMTLHRPVLQQKRRPPPPLPPPPPPPPPPSPPRPLPRPQLLPFDPMWMGQTQVSTSTASATDLSPSGQQDNKNIFTNNEFPLESSMNSLATINLNELPNLPGDSAHKASTSGDVSGDATFSGQSLLALGGGGGMDDTPEAAVGHAHTPDLEIGPQLEPTLQSLIESALKNNERDNRYIPLHHQLSGGGSSSTTTRPSTGVHRYQIGGDQEESEQMSYAQQPPADWADHYNPNYGPYGPYRAPKHQGKRKKKRPQQHPYHGGPYRGGGGGGGKNGGRRPSIKVQKRPRYPANGYDGDGGMVASPSKQHLHEIDSPHDLQPSSTLLRWKYPGLFRPYDYDDDEEEGETEVNIRFFNNFSRMGPLGGVARTAGTATIVISLAFLIISNVSLAATVIAHGISALMKAASQNVSQSPKPKLGSALKFSPTVNTRQEKSPIGHMFGWLPPMATTNTTSTKSPTTTSTSTTTTRKPRQTTTSFPLPSMTFDRQIMALGDNVWR